MEKTIISQKVKSCAFVLICAATVCAFAGCSQKAQTQEKTVSMYELSKAMTDADDGLPDMLNANSNAADAEEKFVYISDMDYKKVDAYFVSYSSEGKADEIAVIAVKDAKDTETAAQSLRKHKEDRIKLYDQYDPSQTQLAKSGKVITYGRYAVLIISGKAEEVENAFHDFIKT